MRYLTGTLFFLIAGLPYLAMLWTGGTSAEAPSPAAAERITIISPHRREVRLEYSRGFREWMRAHHGRTVDIRWLDVGGTSKILKELESRFAARPTAPGVDLLFGGGVAPYITAAQQGWLERVDLPTGTLSNIPPLCTGAPVYDPGGRWFGVALSGFGILYNRPLVERLRLPVPEDWEDLGRPEYFSWVGSGDPRSSGSVHMCYEIILQAYGFEKGWALLTRLCANVRSFGEAGGTAPREVAAGDIVAGMVIDQYARTVMDAVGGNLLVFVLPKRHTVIGPDGIGMLRGADRPDLGRLFIEYALSPDGQRLLFQPAGVNGQRSSLYRMPVLAPLYREPYAPPVNPYDTPAGFVYDDGKGSQRWNVLNDLMGVWLLDAHADLQRAWRRTIAAGAPSNRVARLCAPPVTEADFKNLAGLWKDPRQRQDTMERWALEARQRYRQIAEE
jgi:ABC-type Fe3+ transport system substrate-binding protein